MHCRQHRARDERCTQSRIDLCGACAGRAEPRLLSYLAWSVSQGKASPGDVRPLVEALSASRDILHAGKARKGTLQAATPDDVARILWACVKAEHRNPLFLGQVQRWLTQGDRWRLRKCSLATMLSIAWCFAHFAVSLGVSRGGCTCIAHALPRDLVPESCMSRAERRVMLLNAQSP